ncbi:pyridoxal phosphate-dependent aminotransferase [Ihubacter sp. rT4E-8]|uniref:pyridoxal phosphate-dependent aminotransferase n=1 Tax=Ihubacter sp. rT4E-8 TaxID=3242369 RepID=UPI003CF0E683
MMKEVHGGNIYKFDHPIYDFSANLNPLGMPEEVKQAIISHIDSYESYPDPQNRELTDALSRYHGVPASSICCGNGAADIIFRTALALRPKKALLVSPTFSEYQQALETVDCQVIHSLLTEENGFQPDEKLLADIDDSLDMMFICNPNNPTGIPVPRTLMLAICQQCQKCDVQLVIDECFTEFLDAEDQYSVMADLHRFENVIILKAFTKIYAMAGLRLGYCVCGSEETAEQIRGSLQPWAVSTVAAKAGCAALELTGFVEKTRAYIHENRTLLMDGLKRLGYEVYPSAANYIFFKSSRDLIKPLLEWDIMVRSCSNYVTLDEQYYRIAVRTREENTYFLKCLEKVTERNEGRSDG